MKQNISQRNLSRDIQRFSSARKWKIASVMTSGLCEAWIPTHDEFSFYCWKFSFFCFFDQVPHRTLCTVERNNNNNDDEIEIDKKQDKARSQFGNVT